MEYAEGLEQARSFASVAMEKMEGFNIPATPRNYTVWYAYASGQNPDLAKAVNDIIGANMMFTNSVNDELYDKYFTTNDENVSLHETSKQIEEQVSRVLEVMAGATGGVENFGNKLRSGLGAMADSQGLEDIKNAVQSIAIETQKMLQSNTKLQDRLKESSQEIATLRQNLANVQREAMTDALTGIANRKMFDATLRKRAAEAIERKEPLCLALTDIDHFKTFNDTYGHQTGDQVLKLVARILQGNVKGNDLAARYGGEEFAAVLPNTKIEDARVVCEQIRNAVSSKRIRNRQTGEEMGNITLSIGVAVFRPGETGADFFHRADESLYFAKRNGRNQTIMENQLDSSEAG